MNGPKKGQTWEEYIRWYYRDMPAMAEYLITNSIKRRSRS